MSDEKRLLQKNDWEYWLLPGERILVMCYDDDPQVGYAEFKLSELPNDLVSAGDLECLGIYFEDGKAVYELKIFPRSATA